VIDLLVVRGRRDRSKDVEILVLRHQLAILHNARSRVRVSNPPTARSALAADGCSARPW
jgi:hypothetical protein